jgi:hypothetical protein
VRTDLDTLVVALYVRIDDALKAAPELCRWRPKVGIAPRLSDAELLTLAVAQALLGFTSEARWLRHARSALGHLFSYLPDQSGYNKRLRAAAPQVRYFIRALAADTDLWTDDLWVADSTPVERGRSRQTARRSALAGWAGYGSCASHSRSFWGLRLHLVTTVHGLPVTFALTNPKTDEREVLVDLFDVEPGLLPRPPGPAPAGGQGLPRRRDRSRPGCPRGRGAAAGLQGRGTTACRVAVQGPAPVHLVGQRHPQRPTRPGTPRRADHRRRHRPRAPTPPRPDRSGLAQPQHRPAGHPLPGRLRPRLTPWNQSSRSLLLGRVSVDAVDLIDRVDAVVRAGTGSRQLPGRDPGTS